jgi:hypothetical protein
MYDKHDNIPIGEIGLSSVQRTANNLILMDPIELYPYSQKIDYIVKIHFSVDYMIKKKAGAISKSPENYNITDLSQLLIDQFSMQFCVVDQSFILSVNNQNLVFTVQSLKIASIDKWNGYFIIDPIDSNKGVLMKNSQIVLNKADGADFNLVIVKTKN